MESAPSQTLEIRFLVVTLFGDRLSNLLFDYRVVRLASVESVNNSGRRCLPTGVISDWPYVLRLDS